MTTPNDDDFSLRITQVQARPRPVDEGEPDPLRLQLRLGTTRGDIEALFDVSDGQPGAVVFCSGAMGGEHEVIGPGGRVYERLAGELPALGVSTLRIHYRMAGEFEECVLDVRRVLVPQRRGGGAGRARGLIKPAFWGGVVSLSPQLFGTVRSSSWANRCCWYTGHSFGGAVVIKAGQILPIVCGVVSLSPQLFGTRQVEQLGKPLLLVHGTADAILHHAASEDIYERAQEPKRMVLADRQWGARPGRGS